MYIKKFSDEKQPGLNVKRINGIEVSDEELLRYYSFELEKVGGDSKGQWVNSISMILSEHKIYTKSFSRETFFTSRVSSVINPGEPLSSIQIDPYTGVYRSEIPLDTRLKSQSDSVKKMADFLIEVLDISYGT